MLLNVNSYFLTSIDCQIVFEGITRTGIEIIGKPKMVIIGAAMRKMVRLVYGVLKNKVLFD